MDSHGGIPPSPQSNLNLTGFQNLSGFLFILKMLTGSTSTTRVLPNGPPSPQIIEQGAVAPCLLLIAE